MVPGMGKSPGHWWMEAAWPSQRDTGFKGAGSRIGLGCGPSAGWAELSAPPSSLAPYYWQDDLGRASPPLGCRDLPSQRGASQVLSSRSGVGFVS